jgi:hypothetical protein
LGAKLAIRDFKSPLRSRDVLRSRANAILRNTGKQNPSAIAAFLCFCGFSRSKESACCKLNTEWLFKALQGFENQPPRHPSGTPN